MAPENYIFDNDDEGQLIQPFSKNLLGANLDVVSSLDLVEFQSGADGSLRNSIAYITTWRRRGITGRTQAGISPNAVGTDNSLGSLLTSLWNNPSEIDDLGFDVGVSLLSNDADISFIPEWNPETSLWEESLLSLDLPFYDDTKGKIYSSELYNKYSLDENEKLNTNPSGAQKKQASLMADTAVGLRQGLALAAGLASNALLENNSAASRAVDGTIRILSSTFKAPSGPIYVGNTTGNLIQQAQSLANNFGISLFPGLTTSVAPDLSSKVPKSSSLSSSPVKAYGDGAWQFLFNPSQLSLSAGPDFKKSETWGVMDEPNAGSPLHFKSMKNPELKFSKVLLNGYVFGRKVEELEQGLIELFMDTTSGDAKHGPKVLEFVWGKKSFGPCVIKDIRVNQKMWDEGLLVNAEVDFTLERVPEWTINDGYVSAYDPSEQSTFIEPAPSKLSTQSPFPDSSDKTKPTVSLFEEPEYEYTQQECDTGRYTAKNFTTLSQDPRLSPNLWDQVFGSSEKAANVAVNKYATIYNSYASVLNTLSGLDPICKQKCEYRGQAAPTNNTLIGCAKSCSKQAAKLLTTRYDTGNNKCPNPTLLLG